MKKIFKTIGIILILFVVLIILTYFGLCIYSDMRNRPTVDRFIVGRAYGNFLELLNSKYTYLTYDINRNQIREEEINIYAGGKFKIEFINIEKYFFIYRSSYSYKDGKYTVSKYIDKRVDPNNLISVDDFNKQFFKYSIRTETLKPR